MTPREPSDMPPEWKERWRHVRETQHERWAKEEHQGNLRELEKLVTRYREFNDALKRRLKGGEP